MKAIMIQEVTDTDNLHIANSIACSWVPVYTIYITSLRRKRSVINEGLVVF